MKKLTKVFALVLAFVMLASVTSFAATLVEGTNGKTIDLSFAVTDTSGNTITEVANGGSFIIQVNFAGNEGDPDDTTNLGMCGYNVLVKYDTAKVQITNKQAGLQVTANPTANATFAEGIAYYTAAFEAGALNDSDWAIYEEGNLFRIRAKALADLTKADLDAFEFVKSATNTAGNLTNSTKVIDQDKAEYTITVPDAEPTYEKVADLAKSEKTTIESEDGATQFENVAIFEANFGLDAYKDAVDYGVKYNSKEQSFKAITGEGALNWVIAFWGVPAEVTPAVETYIYK